MKFEDIEREVAEDLKINRTELGEECLRISNLFIKYSSLHARERLILKNYEEALRKLKARKVKLARKAIPHHDITPEEDASFLMSGVVTKGPDVQVFIDDEPDVAALQTKVHVQTEKVAFLKEIVEHIRFRSNQIKNFIDWEKFKHGIVS